MRGMKLALLLLIALPLTAVATGDQEDVVLAEGSLKVGDAAPMFSLPDGNGNVVSLESLLHDGPVVVVFYRGVW